MFVIFGWGDQTKKEYGPTVLLKCPNCNNTAFWHLLHSRVWFTLFFIPVIPYESKHYLLCEVCGVGIELGGLQIDSAKRLNQATLSFLSEEITEKQYEAILGQTPILEGAEGGKEKPLM